MKGGARHAIWIKGKKGRERNNISLFLKKKAIKYLGCLPRNVV